MKSNKDYIKEDKYNKIDELLKKSDIKTFIDDEKIESDDIIDGDDIPHITESTFPGSLNFKMDPMKMSLTMELKAPVNSDNNISIADIKEQIREFGSFCTSQVDWELIRDVYKRIMYEGELIPSVKIATGISVIAYVPEHILLKESLNVDFTPEINDEGKVNFHKIRSFLIVKRGEFLGDIIPELPGSPGRNLLNKEIPIPTNVVNNLVPGEHTFINSGKLYSSIDGTFKLVQNKIVIDPCLTIDTDIDYHTGDIKFVGDVHISKSVREGFQIDSGGDIIINETLEPTNVLCGNDLTVNQGILGSKNYSIICNGSVSTLHVENATIRAKGNVNIENSVVKSTIYSKDRLILGHKSSIIGGVYHIQNGVVVGNIGNSMGVESHIVIGIDFEIEDKLKKVQETSVEVVSEMSHLQEAIRTTNNREERDKIKFLFLSLKNRINSLNNYSRSLLSRLDKNDRSVIIIYGKVFPGTYIEICHISYIVEKELTHVKFFLNKEKGEVDWEYL